jgi:hypothetical protein
MSRLVLKAGWSWGCVAAIDSKRRTIWIVDAHRGDGKRYVVHAGEMFNAFMELQAAISAPLGVSFCLIINSTSFCGIRHT